MKESVNFIIEGKTGKTLVKYLVPSVGSMLGISSLIFIDTMFIGRGIGDKALAALNISIPLFSLYFALGLLFGVGGATIVSISSGKGDTEDVNGIFTLSMLLAAVTSVMLSILQIIFVKEFSYALGASDETYPMVRSYISIISGMTWGYVINTALGVFVRNDNNPRLAMAGMLTGNGINILLDYIFIFIFKMGMAGAALATSSSQIAGFLILMLHFVLKKNHIHFSLREMKRTYVFRIIKNGVPSLLGELSPGVVIFVFNIVIGRISGDTGISAYSIMANIMLVVISVFNGFAQGIQPIISTNYGADNSVKIKETMRYVVFIAAVFSAALFLGQTLFSGELTSIFTRDSGTLRDLSVRALTIGAFAYLFLGINMVEISKFQSKEKTRISTGLSLLKGFIFVLTNLAVLPKMFSLDGVWLSIPLAEFFTFILILIFNRKEHTDYLSRRRINE